MNENEVIIYTAEDGKILFEVNLRKDTVWLSQKQMSELFDKDTDTIGLHIKNIFETDELNETSTTEFFSVVQKEGNRNVKRNIKFYNLDVIISVGYRVNSKRGTQFRIWSTKILKEHLIKGYTVNEKQLINTKEKFNDLQNTIKILEKTIENQNIQINEAKGLFKVITDFNYALSILDKYDHQTLDIRDTTDNECYRITYEESLKIIESMRDDFSTDIFGVEKDGSFKGIIGNIYQTFDGKDLYNSIEEKASNLLYFVVKDHSFIDGNKRIAAAIFIYFLNCNKILYKSDGVKRIADNTLVALTLMIAESKPDEKDTIIKVIVNLINKSN